MRDTQTKTHGLDTGTEEETGMRTWKQKWEMKHKDMSRTQGKRE